MENRKRGDGLVYEGALEWLVIIRLSVIFWISEVQKIRKISFDRNFNTNTRIY